jgi:erythromycin esterase
VIGPRRLVQLGESGHGVAEFDSTKVRLIRFLHEEMGFDVIAFESGLYECFRADERVGELSASGLMHSSIFGVWSAEETLPLFDYLKSTRDTARPLTLAGFDTQFSTALKARPADLRDLLAVIDPGVAADAFALDSELVRLYYLDRTTSRAQTTPQLDDLTARYEALADLIDREQGRLERAFRDRPLYPRVMGQAMRRAPSLLRSLAGSDQQYGAIRDEGMADTLTWLARDLFPDRKIIVWAHNYHVRHDGPHVASQPNMGSFLVKRHRDELYTVGLFMYWGQAAWNDRTLYTLTPPQANSLEALLGRDPPPASFVDLLGQSPSPGTAWMFQRIAAKDWGFTDEDQILSQQYDGILFVDQVHPPHYQ